MSVKTPRDEVSVDLLDGTGTAMMAVESWSLTRDLTGGGLPAQARAASGFASASGRVDVVLDETATPWRRRISPGGSATITAAADATDTLSPVAAMEVREIEASGALTPGRTLVLGEKLGGMRRSVSIPTVLYTIFGEGNVLAQVEAGWAIDQAARAGGYYSTPPPGAGCLASLPLCGSIVPEVGTPDIYGDRAVPAHSWVDTGGGEMALSGSAQVMFPAAHDIKTPLYVSWDTSRDPASSPGNSAPAVSLIAGRTSWPWQLDMAWRTDDALAITVWGEGTGGPRNYVFGSIPLGKSPGLRYARVEVRVEWLGVNAAGTAYDTLRLQARIGPGSWSTPVDLVVPVDKTVPADGWRLNANRPQAALAGGVSGLQAHTSPSAAVWSSPRTTRIAPTGVLLNYVISQTSRSGWDLVQDVSRATLGATWIDENGVLTYRDRAPLRGATTPVERIVAAQSLADVPWSISTDDVADRIEVSFQPVTIETTTAYTLTVWSADKVIGLDPNRVKVMYVDLDGAAADLSWIVAPVIDPRRDYTVFSVNTSPDGSGTLYRGDMVNITTELITPSRLKITMLNAYSQPLWLVDNAGKPYFIVRSRLLVTPQETATYSSGKTEAQSANPLVVNLGSWVQRPSDALDVLTWLEGVTANPLPVLRDVRVLPNPARRLGDVAVLVDPLTGISSKVLVTGKTDSMSGGALTQTLTLTVLDTIFDDLDRVWAGMTFDQLDVLLTGKTFDDLDAYLFTIGGL